MSFGLTNAPTTFQGLMNEVFQKFLRWFLSLFFYDIFVYNKSLEEHLEHLKQVLLTIRSNFLFARRSKCYFAVNKVEYLGHFISGAEVSTDTSKIQVMINWPLQQTIKQLKGFLGLAEYYGRFIKGYGIVAKPLIDMLKNMNSACHKRLS